MNFKVKEMSLELIPGDFDYEQGIVALGSRCCGAVMPRLGRSVLEVGAAML